MVRGGNFLNHDLVGLFKVAEVKIPLNDSSIRASNSLIFWVVDLSRRLGARSIWQGDLPRFGRKLDERCCQFLDDCARLVLWLLWDSRSLDRWERRDRSTTSGTGVVVGGSGLLVVNDSLPKVNSFPQVYRSWSSIKISKFKYRPTRNNAKMNTRKLKHFEKILSYTS